MSPSPDDSGQVDLVRAEAAATTERFRAYMMFVLGAAAILLAGGGAIYLAAIGVMPVVAAGQLLNTCAMVVLILVRGNGGKSG